ncbi:MAG TPA: hypothetical protein VGO91_00930 [Pyrinomonadaceae bacterium]|jgi:hypothetical protein|nr:hypothetical protein [Pyrinomonadaceae bacterium]
MRYSQILKRESGEGTESLFNGGILIALGLSVFVLNEWPGLNVSIIVGLAWTLFFIFIKGPELARHIRRTE